MNKTGLFSIGIRVILTVLALVSLSATTLTHANGGVDDNRYVPVAYDGFVKYALDITTVKQHTSLSGNMLVDVWIEGRLDTGAGRHIQAFLGGYPPGVDYEKVGTVRMRYLFRVDGQNSGRETLAAVVERKYFDLNGGVIIHEPLNPPDDPFIWHITLRV